MESKTSKIFRQIIFLSGALLLGIFSSCEKEPEPAPDPVASFQYEISEDNYLEVSFTSFSQNAVAYSWNFGDGGTSTEENPTHIYDEVGIYDVTLTVENSDGVVSTFSETIEITDPLAALRILVGESSKDWRLLREGVAIGIGPGLNEDTGEYDYTSWWNLENDGSRPCVFNQTWTFSEDGTMTFDDGGQMWGDDHVFDGTDRYGVCFEATSANMINKDGVDVSDWLGGSYEFDYNPSAGTLTLNGSGAWMGLLKVSPDGYIAVPGQSITYDVTITEEQDYDWMAVSVWIEGESHYWQFNYVSYHDWANEPEVETEAQEWGEDLPNITPDEIFITFASRDAAEMATIDTIASGSTVEFGVDDPTDAAADKVGEFTRTAGVQWQELQFRAAPEPKDIQFDNFTKAKIDIYIPANTEFVEGGLQRHFVFGFADMSATQEWWNSPVQFVVEGEDVVLGTWTTYEFDLENVKEREDLDMIYLGIGGGGHEAGGTFYVRDLIFE